jgi:hypothetical protein
MRKDADRSQRFHQIGGMRRLGQLADIGEQTLGYLTHRSALGRSGCRRVSTFANEVTVVAEICRRRFRRSLERPCQVCWAPRPASSVNQNLRRLAESRRPCRVGFALGTEIADDFLSAPADFQPRTTTKLSSVSGCCSFSASAVGAITRKEKCGRKLVHICSETCSRTCHLALHDRPSAFIRSRLDRGEIIGEAQ